MSEDSLASSVPSSANTIAVHAKLKAMKARLDGFEAAGPRLVFPPQSNENSMKSDDTLLAELKQVRDQLKKERTRRRRAESTVGLLGLQLMVVGLVGDLKKDACVFVRAAHWWLSGNMKLGLIWGSVVHCDVFVLVCCAFCMLGNVHLLFLEVLDTHLVKVQRGGYFFWRRLS